MGVSRGVVLAMLDSRAAIAWNADPMFNRITFLLAASMALAACTAETTAPASSSSSPAAAATGTVAKFSLGKTA